MAGVIVNLYADQDADGTLEPDGDDSTVYASVVTNAEGYYRFDNLMPDTYMVEIPASEFGSGEPLYRFASSLDATFGVGNDPDSDADDINDNGVDVSTQGQRVRSQFITLGDDVVDPTVAVEPTADDDEPGTGLASDYGNAAIDPDDAISILDTRSNLTVDFGFFPYYGLGNVVWYDNDNNSLIDYGEGETGVSGVVVNLYRDTDGNGTVEPLGADSTPFRTATTSSTVGDEGYYRFDMLPVGQYIVGIPANQFASSAVLDGYISSNYLTEPDPDANASDTDDSGRDASTPANPIVDGVYSLPVTIGLDGSGLPEQDPNSFEPTGETDEPTSYPASAVDTDALASATDRPEDKRENLTVDFGFFRPLSLGNRVWIDYNGDGDIDTG